MSGSKALSNILIPPHLERVGGEIKDPESAVGHAADDLQAWKRIYELCIELRNFEITQLVQRNNFFMVFQGVLLAGICQSAGKIPVVSFVICLVGFVVSLLQAGMAAGAKYWQSHWEINTRAAEIEMVNMLKIHSHIHEGIANSNVVIDTIQMSRIKRRRLLIHLFHEDYNKKEIMGSLGGGRVKRRVVNSLIMFRCSASRIPIYAGLFLAFAWGGLLLCTMKFDFIDLTVFDFIVGFPSSKD